jgi:hypothetical protein
LGQLKKRKLPLPQDRFSTPIKIMQQANKIEEVRTKRRKVLYQVDEQNHRPLSGFQTGEFIRFSDRR